MALIEVFHVVASSIRIDADNATDIPQGLLLTLDANYLVTPFDNDVAAGAGTAHCIGIAGDTRSTGVTSFTPESGSALSRNPKTSLEGALVTGAYGASQRYTQNRVSDNYNEVLASGKMTVYHSGGEFWTDQYEVVNAAGGLEGFGPAVNLYGSGAVEAAAAVPAADVSSRLGRLTGSIGTAQQVIGRVINDPTAYPSGVPGTDVGFTALPEGGNSLTWGNFLHFQMGGDM